MSLFMLGFILALLFPSGNALQCDTRITQDYDDSYFEAFPTLTALNDGLGTYQIDVEILTRTDSSDWFVLTREALVSYHARLMHVVLVSEDLDAFAHVHPEDFPADNPAYQDGAVAGAHANFTVRATFPKAGKYLMALNYRIASSVTGLDVIEDSPHVHPWGGGNEVYLDVSTQNVVCVNATDLPQMEGPLAWDPRNELTVHGMALEGGDGRMTDTMSLLQLQDECCLDNPALMCPVSPMMNMSEPTDPGCYTLSLSAMPLAGGGGNSSMGGMGGMGAPTVQAGECSMLSFSVMRNGAHVADLNPYLEASTHVFIVSSNLENSYHVHGMAASQMTPQMRTCMHMDHDAAPSTFSSPLMSNINIEQPDMYKVFVTLQHNDTLIQGVFSLAVLPAGSMMNQTQEGMQPIGSCAWQMCDSVNSTASTSTMSPTISPTGNTSSNLTMSPTVSPNGNASSYLTVSPTVSPTVSNSITPTLSPTTKSLAGNTMTSTPTMTSPTGNAASSTPTTMVSRSPTTMSPTAENSTTAQGTASPTVNATTPPSIKIYAPNSPPYSSGSSMGCVLSILVAMFVFITVY
mmetsp:Transcript_26741/g.50929  ORF Transcript_26741/g.50929 Transcript_26741/m.50929 type:complete len:575 (+) Transcript_26741:73-1797(+)